MPLRPDPDALGFVLIDVSRLLRSAFERRILGAGLGVTPGEARTLIHVAAHEGSRQLDIAARMGVEPMTLSSYLDRLQAMGFIERRPDAADRRAKQVFTTPAADELITGLRIEQIGLMNDVTAGLSPDDRERLREKLMLMRSNLQDIDARETAPAGAEAATR